MRDFTSRLRAAELMDDPGIPAVDLRDALRQLERINVALGGYRPSLGGLRRLIGERREVCWLLDVGTGGGDVARRIVLWARRRRLPLRVVAIDVSPVCIEYARERSRDFQEIEFRCADLFDLPLERRFDVVHGSLVLHHFDGGEALRAVQRMRQLAHAGVVINDLHRHGVAYHSFRCLSACLWRNRLIRHDGPISVRRGFRRRDLEELARAAGAATAEVRWRWGFRWQVVIPAAGWERDSDSGAVR